MKLIKYISFIGLSFVSVYLSINMFISLGADLLGKIILGLLAMFLEGVKIFSLLRIEALLYARRRVSFSLNASLAGSFFVYIFTASLSIVASLGFSLVTVDKQVESSKAIFYTQTSDTSFAIDQKKQSIILLDTQIQALQNQISNINPDLATGSTKLSFELQKLMDRRDTLIAEITALEQEQHKATIQANTGKTNNTYGMFVLMGAPFHLSEKTVMSILLLAISILLEVSMIYTSPTIPIKDEDLHELSHSLLSKNSQEHYPPKTSIQEETKKVSFDNVSSSIEESYKEETPNIPDNIADVSAIGTIQPRTLVTGKSQGLDFVAHNIVPISEIAGSNIHIHSPLVTTEQQAKRVIPEQVLIKNILTKIITPIQGTELKNPVVLADELRVPPEVISSLLNRIAVIRGPSNGPLLVRKGTAWHLNQMKELIIAYALRNGSIVEEIKAKFVHSQKKN